MKMKRFIALFFSLILLIPAIQTAYPIYASKADEPPPKNATLWEADLIEETDSHTIYYEPEIIELPAEELPLMNEEALPAQAEQMQADDEELDMYNNYSFEAENNAQLDGAAYMQDEIIIKFKDPSQIPGQEKQLQHEIEKVEKIGFVESLGVYVVRTAEMGKNPQAVLNRFKNNKYIESVEPNYIVNLEYIPNDPGYARNQSLYLSTIKAQAGWDIIKGSNYAPIAIIDSGIISLHPDLPPLLQGYAAEPGLSYENDKVGHGTGVAGVIAAIGDNALAGAGLNWNAALLAVKADNANGVLSAANVAKGIIWAADNGAKIINLSLGLTSDSLTIKNAVDYAYNKGCAIFAAAGNGGKNSIEYPARYDNVIAVGSVEANGAARYYTSNYGSGLDVMATDTYYSTTASGGSAFVTGTSFATPQVAALASLLWGVNPQLSNAQIYDLIRRGASGNGAYINDELGYGIINFEKSLQLATTINGGGEPPLRPETPPQEIRTPPIITLNGFTALNLEYGQTYQEMGYLAVDCKGLNLNNSVVITNTVNSYTPGLYSITYEVADSAGLTARATRSVTVLEQPATLTPPTTPKITLNGSNPIILHQTSNTPYTEQGAKAVDYNGEDISPLVKISGNLNRSLAGTYTLTYTIISPSSGLSAATTRNIRIVAPSEKKDPRITYTFSAQAKQGAQVTHTGIVANALGYMNLQITAIDKNMSISARLIETTTKKALLTDVFSAAGTKQYLIEEGKYELQISINKANGNSKYEMTLTMPETAATYYFNEAEIPLAKLPISPKISYIGSNPIILHLGSATPYFEQGARAIDYDGQDISTRIKIIGAPIRDIAGTYIITYSVENDQGQSSYITREVQILAPTDAGVFTDEEVPLAEWETIMGNIPQSQDDFSPIILLLILGISILGIIAAVRTRPRTP
ncbi:MAG: DUF5011 domain-containing protein [Firmicutes bacterium]|nr:DUF5011 domain-containing protein [Bacillota bacterium]